MNKKEVRMMMRLVRALAIVAMGSGEWKRLVEAAIDDGMKCNVHVILWRVFRTPLTEQAIAWTMYKNEPWFNLVMRKRTKDAVAGNTEAIGQPMTDEDELWNDGWWN